MSRKVIDPNNSSRKSIEARLRKEITAKGGLQTIASGITNPVKETQDIKGIMRKIFVLVTNWAKGFHFQYETDMPRIPAIKTAKGAVGSYQVDVSPERIIIDDSPMQITVYVSRDDLYTRTYDVLKRVRERMVEGLVIREDSILLALLSVATHSGLGHPIVTTAGKLNQASVIQAMNYIEGQNLPAVKLITNPSGIKGIRSFPRATMDDKGLQEIRETGYLGSLFGLNFSSSILVEPGHNFLVSNPEFIGEYFIRLDQDIQPIEKLEQAKVGFVGYQLYGASVHNAKGVVEIEFDPNA